MLFSVNLYSSLSASPTVSFFLRYDRTTLIFVFVDIRVRDDVFFCLVIARPYLTLLARHFHFRARNLVNSRKLVVKLIVDERINFYSSFLFE